MIGKFLAGLAGAQAARRIGVPGSLIGIGLATARRSPRLGLALAAGAGVLALRRARKARVTRTTTPRPSL